MGGRFCCSQTAAGWVEQDGRGWALQVRAGLPWNGPVPPGGVSGRLARRGYPVTTYPVPHIFESRKSLTECSEDLGIQDVRRCNAQIVLFPMVYRTSTQLQPFPRYRAG